MQDYKVTMTKPWLAGSKTVYVSGESAEVIQAKIEERFADELEDGVTYQIEKL